MTVQLDGPRLAPASGGAPKQLVIFCHGYGADGNDLIGLGQQWRNLLPDAAFVSPHAPERCGMSPMGYQWFPISRLDPGEYWDGVREAGPILNAFIDSELARHRLEDDALALVGFSQGTMMLLHVGLRRAAPAAAILGYSGALAGPEHLEAEIRCRPPVMLIHGDQDEVIPVQALNVAAGALGGADVSVQWHVSQGIGHGIDGAGLALGGEFLRTAFATARV
jgi:phospholipase/carboxylesterase